MDHKQLRCAYKTRNITAEPKYTGAIKTYECPGWKRSLVLQMILSKTPISGAKIAVSNLPFLFFFVVCWVNGINHDDQEYSTNSLGEHCKNNLPRCLLEWPTEK